MFHIWRRPNEFPVGALASPPSAAPKLNHHLAAPYRLVTAVALEFNFCHALYHVPMSRLMIALVLLFVTGLLTVTGVVSSSLVNPVFIILSTVLLFSVLVLVCHLYVYSADPVRGIVSLYDCYELVNYYTPGFKSYSDWHILALLQIGVEQLRQQLKDVVSGWCRSLGHGLSMLIGRITTSLAIARSRLQPYRDALPYSTSRIVIAAICLTYLGLHCTLLALRYAAARLAGLALSLYDACTPISIGLFIIITSILAYPFRGHLARCQTVKHIESICRALRTGLSLEFDELYDKDHDFSIEPEPEPEPENFYGNADYLPSLDERQAYTQVADRPTDTSPPEAPSPVHNQSYTGIAAGFRPRPDFSLVRLRYEDFLRMQQAGNTHQDKIVQNVIGSRFVPQPARLPSILPSTALTPIDEISRSLGSMSLRDDQTPCTMTARQQRSQLDHTSSSPGHLIESPAASPITSSPSHGSLPELVPDTDTSDNSSELSTSSDERYEANNTIVRPSSKDSKASLRRVRGFITRVQPKSSPLYAPKEIVEPQTMDGEDKVAAVLHRSQWKQGRNRWATSKKHAKKSQAPIDPRPCSLVVEPMDTTAAGTETRRPGVEELVEAATEPRVSNIEAIRSPVVLPSPAQASSPLPQAVDASIAQTDASAEVRKIKELPRRKSTRPGTATASATPSATTPARMEFESKHTLPSGSPGSPSPTNELETSTLIPSAPGRPLPMVMTPKDLATAINEKAKTSGTRKTRVAPVYTLLDKERTVVNKGEKIPPRTQYQVKDEKGTSLRVTGSKGMLKKFRIYLFVYPVVGPIKQEAI
ncbi:hypothetical protein FRC08_018521 [Ceratobasidium sp. 394]|nr:hypothetical protein FRC08_018521 [Ceratobasidium sp. 394]